ncbi:MAG: hypothetical protein EPN69_08165 [Rhodanobacter sp.]|nr:MAG: hypothetical protein EPN69_08165 [Rhodanobacter sp.]TAM00656.1 MAG: hypothetical protein EPN71_06335 [Rhodanobacter sp.]TAM40633.1 MAG: hypothetical protein EPN58_09780 [Rhodanobacter sp.]TAN25550.1 MAG: hypothetical protein EPN32_09415 [Rhodanobacter sp.]
MDWSTLLRMPMTVLLVLAAVFVLVALVQLVVLRRHLRARRHLAASGRAVLCVVCFALALLLAGTGAALRGYRLLGEEAPVVDIDAQILSPQRWALTLTSPDGSTRQVQLAGDDWRVEAIVLKWKLPALLAGVPPLYRLDRLSGRYDDPTQEMSAARTVISFDSAGSFDLVALSREYPKWLPEVDTVYGSGAFLPLVDGGHYAVSLMRSGALVARPDAATAQRISHPLGG